MVPPVVPLVTVLVTGAGTVVAALLEWPSSSIQVMVAVPAAFAVTRPAETMATSVFEELHLAHLDVVSSEITVPFASSANTWNCLVVPIVSVAPVGVIDHELGLMK